ncbi:MAG: cell wall hydrolase [Desulfobacterales bacterium]|nr:cell wall hydrolase [Deltaproteobacteria bacterium]MBT8361921.1 cell wall hydrolase [Deltaproteobacteria bacterium]NNK96358.1 cell wall hydrolase [Desulfobacterales bacterium]
MTLLEGLLWLTLNVYHEGRSETEIGQVAIAHVTLNRAFEKHLPIKDIVKQPYQFSWTFQRDSYLPDDPDAFAQCLRSVFIALRSPDFTSGATHYHLETIEPAWASSFTYIDQYGSHKFYK